MRRYVVKANKSLPKTNKKHFKVFASAKYQVGDFVEYDGNWYGINPKLGKGKIIQVEPGLAGRGDTNPDPIYLIENDTGRRFKLDQKGILKKIENIESCVDPYNDINCSCKDDVNCSDNFRPTGEQYNEISSKSVPDTDGFMTDYTMYYDWDNDKFIFILGDKDLYNPENSDPDYECESGEEAEEWFDSYGVDDIYSSNQVNASSGGSAFEITQEDALAFLDSLPQSKLGRIYYQYNTSDNDELSFIIDDKDLIALGYPVSTKNSTSEVVDKSEVALKISQEDALAFLNRLSESELGEMYYNYNTDDNEYLSYIINDEDLIKLGYPASIESSTNTTNVLAYDESGLDALWDEIRSISQEFTSENTSINSGKLPAIFNMVKFEPGTINVDYGGGRFDNVAEYLAKVDVVNLVFDPFNRSADHNKQVIDLIRKAGGADTATCSNVLNVIKEPEVRQSVLNNIRRLTKDGGKVYFTVYEGKGNGQEGPTKSGYQLNRKTADYLEEIQKMFPDAKRKGKLIIATNGSNSVNSASSIQASITNYDIVDVYNTAVTTIDENVGSVMGISSGNSTIPSEHFTIIQYDSGSYIVSLGQNNRIEIYGDDGELYSTCASLEDFRNYCRQINNNSRQMNDEFNGQYSANASTCVDGSCENTKVEGASLESIELEPSEELIEIPFDCNITIEDDTWEYEDPTYDWAEGDGSEGKWYSQDGVFIGDKISMVECIDDMLVTRLPDTPGKYHISGIAKLVFDISGVTEYSSFEGKDEDGDPIIDRDLDLGAADSGFNIQKSDIENFKFEVIE